MTDRKIPVIYQQKRKLINVDLSGVESLRNAISRRLKITNEIKLFGKRTEHEEYFDIEDDEDLEGLEDMDGLILLAQTESGSSTSKVGFQHEPPLHADPDQGQYYPRPYTGGLPGVPYPPDHGHHQPPPPVGLPVGPGPAQPFSERPPEYAESMASRDSCDSGQGYRGYQASERSTSSNETGADQSKIAVTFGPKTKQIRVGRNNFELIYSSIANRFLNAGNFQLQIKDDSGNMVDIDSDEDIADNREYMHHLWVIQNDANALQCAKQNELSLVVVNKENYSLTESPAHNSKLVLIATEKLKKDICIPSISSKLNEVEECLRIAYYASMGNKDIHRKTQDMQFDIEKLCQQCDTIMLRIKLKSGDILNELQCGFGYLLDGFEDFGLERLGAVGDIAENVQRDAESLTDLMSVHQDKVTKGLESVTKQDNEETAASKKQQLQREKDGKQQFLNSRSHEVQKSQGEIDHLRSRERSAEEASRRDLSSDSGIGFGFKKLITLGFYKGSSKCAEHEEQIAREMRQEQEKEKATLKRLKEDELKAKIELEQFILKMNSQPKNMSDTAIQGAENGMKTLKSFLQSLANFWKQNQAEFQSLNTGFIDNLKKESDPEARKAFWTSRGFKREAMNYIAKFAAIEAMCIEFHETMTKVLDDIHRCIRDNPTPEEAKQKLPQLISQFKQRETPRPQPLSIEYDEDIEDVNY